MNASSLPYSIIIIGVGGADFDAMEELDGDDVRISYNGRMAERDIVQFVPYRDAHSWVANSEGGPATGSWVTGDATDFTNKFAQSQLAAEVLAEIPEQLTGYMKSKGILPKLPSEKPATPLPPMMAEAAQQHREQQQQQQQQQQNPNATAPPPKPHVMTEADPLPPPQINPLNQDIPEQPRLKSPPKPPVLASNGIADHPPVIMQKSSPPSVPTVVKAQEQQQPVPQTRLPTPPKLQPEQPSLGNGPSSVET